MVQKSFFEALRLRCNSIARIERKQPDNWRIKLQLVFLFAAIALSLVSNNLHAQAISQPLKPEDAIQAAITKNSQVTLSTADEKIALSNYKQVLYC